MNRVVVLALLCLLTFATSVAAECAWVLWVHSLHTDGSLHEQYFVELSRPTRQECYQEASNYAIPLKEQGYRVVRVLKCSDKKGRSVSNTSASPTPWTRVGRRGSEQRG